MKCHLFRSVGLTSCKLWQFKRDKMILNNRAEISAKLSQRKLVIRPPTKRIRWTRVFDWLKYSMLWAYHLSRIKYDDNETETQWKWREKGITTKGLSNKHTNIKNPNWLLPLAGIFSLGALRIGHTWNLDFWFTCSLHISKRLSTVSGRIFRKNQ